MTGPWEDRPGGHYRPGTAAGRIIFAKGSAGMGGGGRWSRVGSFRVIGVLGVAAGPAGRSDGFGPALNS